MADRTGLAHGTVRITCDDPQKDLVVLLGTDPPKITGGVGGWDVTARPRQVGMTTWGGVEPFQVDLSLMLDGHATGTSVESQLGDLVAIARGDNESDGPGLAVITGIELPARRWVIESMDFGDALLSAATGERTRQALGLTLREYVPPSYLRVTRSAVKGSRGKTKTLRAKHGDTPAKMAQRQRCQWTEIRELNPGTVRKANQVLKADTKVRVPVAKRRDRKPPSRRGS